MHTPPIIASADLSTSLTCWKCGARLVLRGRGLYCNHCHRYRKFLFKGVFHWKRRCGWARVDVRESGRQKRKVMLKGER